MADTTNTESSRQSDKSQRDSNQHDVNDGSSNPSDTNHDVADIGDPALDTACGLSSPLLNGNGLVVSGGSDKEVPPDTGLGSPGMEARLEDLRPGGSRLGLPTTMTDSCSDLETSEQERVGELARLDQESLANLECLVLGSAPGQHPGGSFSPEWSPSDEITVEPEPGFSDGDDTNHVDQSDQSAGSRGSLQGGDFSSEAEAEAEAEADLTDYENSPAVEREARRRGRG